MVLARAYHSDNMYIIVTVQTQAIFEESSRYSC